MTDSVLPPVDLDALRSRYRIERDKRLRPDGYHQYIQTSGEFSHISDQDPYAPPFEPRPPLTDFVEVLIVGGGFGGILAAAAMKKAGISDLRIIEHGGDFGGTWYWNRYPGAQCDVESYVYLPLLEETGYIPRERYSYAPEIFDHVQRLVGWYELRPTAVFQTRVERITWQEGSRDWLVETNRGDRFRARFVISATGFLVNPKLPGIPGIASFEGKTFHTARWDYGYTGGDHSGGLTGLEDKRVAIIGTGATAIQVVPIVARHARQLVVFQRTPSSVDDRGNAPTDAEWASSLEPGWQQERQDNLDRILSGEPLEESLVLDGWTVVWRRTSDLAAALPETDRDHLYEVADAEHMEKLRARVADVVGDEAASEALKPWFRHGCKRPTFSDEYLPAFNRPNVTLVDTSPSRGVEEIRPNAVVVAGREYEVDCIIFATGFDVNTTGGRRVGMEIIGRGGRSIADHWAEGMRTLHGHSAHGFPNWFFVGPSQTPATVNFSGMVTKQSRLIAGIITAVRSRGAAVEATAEGEEAWVREVARLASDDDAFLESCTPGFRNSEGGKRTINVFASYNGSTHDFDRMIEDWLRAGDLAGMVVHGEIEKEKKS